MKKKLLFIGDLRKANNWGAQLTSTNLIEWIEERYSSWDIKYISERSWVDNTPEDGFKDTNNDEYKHIKWHLKKFLWGIGFLSLIKFSKGKVVNTEDFEKLTKSDDYIPDKFEEYEIHWKKMKSGEILKYELEALTWADKVIINSEGSIVNDSKRGKRYRRSGRYNLFMAWVAKTKLMKQTMIINHTYDPKNHDIDLIAKNVYPKLDLALIRERLSIKNLEKIIPDEKLSNIKFFPDFAFNSERQYENKNNDLTVCIGESAGLKSVTWDIYYFYDEIFKFLTSKGANIIFADGNSEKHRIFGDLYFKYKFKWIHPSVNNHHSLARNLRKSHFFFSGRWHASILSLVNETPVILYGSDSHKVKALSDLYDNKLPYFDIETLDQSIVNIKREMSKIIDNKDKGMTSIKNVNKNLKSFFKQSI